MNTSSMTCVGWSTAGRGERFSHASEKYNHIWLVERIRFAELGWEDVFFAECTAAFPAVQKLSLALEATHEVYFMVVGPENLGWPCRRPRMLAVGFNRKTMKFVGDDEWVRDFKDKHFKATHLTGKHLLTAEEPERWAYYRSLAHAQGNHMSVDDLQCMDNEELLSVLLPPGQLRIRKQYKEVYNLYCSLGGCMIADLEQNFGTGCSTPGPDVPCLLTHGHLMSFEHEPQARPVLFTPLEHMSIQGIHVHDMSTMDFEEIKIAPMLRNLSKRPVKKLAGNAINNHVLSAFWLYMMSNVRRVPPLNPQQGHPAPAPEHPELEDGEDGDGDDEPSSSQASQVPSLQSVNHSALSDADTLH